MDSRRPSIDPDRHELFAGPTYRFELDRRGFLRVLGGGIAVVVVAGDLIALDGSRALAATEFGDADDDRVAAWLHVGEDGNVTVYTGKVEVGQDIRTSLTQAVADELRMSPDTVRMVMGDTALTPFDIGTFGSRTTPQMAPQLRRAAATLRESLARLAAEQWDVDAADILVGDGRISHPESGRDIGYGEVAVGRALARRVDEDARTTRPRRWRVAGRSQPKVNGRAFVTGRHRFTSDLRLRGMLHGRVLRPPTVGAELRSLDASRAEALPGVTVVRDVGFVGVAAPDVPTAQRAIALLDAEWTSPPAAPSDRDVFEHLRATARPTGGGRSGHRRGDLAAGTREAAVRVEATYTTAYIAHVPLEPRAALARWEDDELTVWTGTQRPFGVRRELAEAFRLPEERVRVIMPDTGSAYGGKHTGETAVEAARLARAAGRPVRLVWTREEEFRWAYFRPAALIEAAAGARSDGRLTAWEVDNYNAGAAALRPPYEVPNQSVRFLAADSPLRQGSYRALAATANNFARESLMDELAHALGVDPLELRLRNLSDARLRAVLEAAAARFGWGTGAESPGLGHGIACGVEKGGYVGCCVEASVDGSTGEVRIERVVTAFECGAIVNPNHLRSQVEGCVVMGLGGALFEAIEFEGGRILNGRLADYRVPRFSDVPRQETVLLNRRDLPSAGAGETPIIGIAPALASAIFQATGQRLRALPLAPNGVRV